jgi:capsular exopolysaccharide synthesis family protein
MIDQEPLPHLVQHAEMIPARQEAPAAMPLALVQPQHSSALNLAVPTDLDPPVIDIAELWHTILKRWKLISLCMGLCMAGGLAYLKKAVPLYQSKASVEVKQEKDRTMSGMDFGSTDFKSLEVLKTLEAKIVTQSMLQRIIQLNKLDSDPTFTPPRATPYQLDELIAMLGSRVAASLNRGTRMIDIVVRDTDPERAKRIALSFAEECKKLSEEENSETAGKARDDLAKELERARASLETAEKSVNEFRRNHPAVSLPDRPSDIKTNEPEDRIKVLVNQLTQIRERIIRLSTSMERIRRTGPDGTEALLQDPEIARNEEVIALQKLLNEKRATFAQLDAELLPKHPRYIKAREELDQVERNLRNAVVNAVAGMENALANARNEETQLSAEMNTAKGGSLQHQEVLDHFEPLRREMAAQREHYDQVLRRLKEAQISADFTNSLLTISDYPVVASKPFWPSKKMILGGSVVVGLGLGVGLALLLQLLDRTFRTLQQVERELHLPALTAIPINGIKDARLRILTNPATSVETSEAFRSLRTSLSILGKGIHAKTFLFTSAADGEGKSYCALNYAIALAQQGYRTLIIDANLREPAMDDLLLGRRNAAGMATHLRGQTDIGDSKACNATRVPGLYLFSAGISNESHPAELLSEQSFRQLLADAGKWFHRIVVDTPAVNQVTDALLMAREVDSVVLVISAGKTERNAARQASSKLSIAGSRPVGFILNHADQNALTGAYLNNYAPVANPLSAHPMLASSSSPQGMLPLPPAKF